MNAVAAAGGLFGPLQTVSRQAGGLNTAVGYWYHQETFKNHTEHVVRQNQLYSQAAYGAGNLWEIYGRIGISEMKIDNAFKPTDILTATSKNHFKEDWKFFGTLGAKGFYPINSVFGVGAFLQGTYNFSNFSDRTARHHHTTPFIADLNIKNLWDIHFGVGVQATVPCGIKLYSGPYVYYTEADAHLSRAIQGIPSGTKHESWKNKSVAGGFLGADIPLAKGFRLNIEGQYTDRFSIGSAITYTY